MRDRDVNRGPVLFFVFFVFVLSRSLEQAKVKERFQYIVLV